jgi:putative polyketide hydroxylase
MTATASVPVLVVGAGPAGLAAAVELARHEVDVLLVERRRAPSSHPRATVLSLRSMELMRRWGLETAARARSADVAMSMLEAPTLARAGEGSAIEVGYPSAAQSRVLSPTAPACIAQDDVETLLLEYLGRQRNARVEPGTELVGLARGADGAGARLRDVETGATRTVHARYVVAADGANSAARDTLGVEMIGLDDVFAGVSTLFRAPLWDVVGPRRHLLYSVSHPEAVSAVLPTGASDRWLIGHDTRADLSQDELLALIRRAVGVHDLPATVERSRRFTAGAQIASAFRAGNVFMAGDAAHRVTPRGGTGLNVALHDGFDIGWKLAWVLRGWANPALLETYEAERRPVAEHAVARTADLRGSRRSAQQELHVDLGGRIAHVWVGDDSTLDLLGAGLTLFAAGGRAPRVPTSPAPVTIRLLDPVVAAALGAVGDTAVLVRPDGRMVALLDGSGGRGVDRSGSLG